MRRQQETSWSTIEQLKPKVKWCSILCIAKEYFSPSVNWNFMNIFDMITTVVWHSLPIWVSASLNTQEITNGQGNFKLDGFHLQCKLCSRPYYVTFICKTVNEYLLYNFKMTFCNLFSTFVYKPKAFWCCVLVILLHLLIIMFCSDCRIKKSSQVDM